MGFVARHRLELFVTLAIVLVAAALWLARSALPVFAIAIALAFLLDPPVTSLSRSGVPRVAGILLVYVAVVAAVIGLGWLLLPPLFDQLRRFLEQLPTLAAQFVDWEQALVDWLTSLPLPQAIRDALDSIIESGQQAVVALLEAIVGPLLSLIARAAGFVFGLVVVPVWLLYVLKDRERLPDGILGLLPAGWRPDASHAIGLTTSVIGRWIRGQLLLGAVIFVATLVGLLVLSAIGFREFADFAVLLALVAGVPTIVSATGTYLDIPRELVVRVASGPADPVELAARIRELRDDPERRARIGEAARAHMAALRDSDATAKAYEQAILATRDIVLDPARAVLARWAGSLAAVGVDDTLVGEGYGVSYARALESFQRSP